MKKYLLHNKTAFTFIMLLKALQSAISVGFALVLQYGINMLSNKVSMIEFWYMILFMVGYIVLFGVVLFVKEAASVSYTNKAVDKLRSDFAGKLISLPYEEFSKSDSSKYISNLTNDMKLISANYFTSLMSIPEEIFSFVFAIAASFYIHYAAALTMIGLTLLVFVVPVIFNKPLNKANLALSESMKEFTRIIKETFLGIDVIKNFNSEERIGLQINSFSGNLAKKNTVTDRLNAFSSGTGIMIVVILQIGSIAISGYLMLQGFILIGAVIAIVQLGNNLFMPIVNISSKAALVGGVRELNKTVTDVLEKTKTPCEKQLAAFENSFTLKNVTFRYEGDEKTVLQDVSLCFDKGKKYLIAGRSGSGKSTLLKIIAKMYEGYEGQAEIDGIPIRKVDTKELNGFVSFAQQKSYLFNRTVKENIDFNSTSDSEKLSRAIELSCLGEFLDRLENGLETVIDEEVNQVSGGEKLRVGLARALYKDTDVLLLDEITSALDKETAHRVEKNVLSLDDKTVVNVSHKIHEDLLNMYDKIGIMEDGRLILFDKAENVRDSEDFKKYILSSAAAANGQI